MKRGAITLLSRLLLAAAIGLFGGAVSAAQLLPDSGRWVNPSEGGRNFNIEIQDNQLTLVTQLYENGVATWFYSQGTMASADRYLGILQRWVGGQCMGCAYTPPTLAGTVGNVEIRFDSPMTATLTWPGGTTHLEHRDSAIGLGSNSALLGEWAIVEGSETSPQYWGERLTFNELAINGGQQYAYGMRSGAPENWANGLYNPAAEIYAIYLDVSDNFGRYYEFSFYGQQSIRGHVWTVDKVTSTFTGGTAFVGFRMKSAAMVVDGNGPGMEEEAYMDDPAGALRLSSRARVDADVREESSRLNVHTLQDRGEAPARAPRTEDMARRTMLLRSPPEAAGR